ncbi:hypothetical protein RND71_004577 [Anisodus tanguticus]|uniref:K Homology domain-containing protein n=1 Tax=Anisodus tanguticus TaxID=243964 RepID=A0AAE1VUW3_9SOLA|nr:hypothetical protein RND71_004577 [Anisodus tanguticus]
MKEILVHENPEQRHSPAQEALMRVQGRIAEIGFEPGAAVVSRLLVHARHMSCLIGNGSILIAELRRVTGASIHIFPREQSPKYGSHIEEVLQVIGSMQSVQDALFQITCRLRDAMFPVKPHVSNIARSIFPPTLKFHPHHSGQGTILLLLVTTRLLGTLMIVLPISMAMREKGMFRFLIDLLHLEDGVLRPSILDNTAGVADCNCARTHQFLIYLGKFIPFGDASLIILVQL